jgi:hypothetical protein
MKNVKTINVPYEGKGHKVSYTVESIDLGIPDLQFVNVYTVFPHDGEVRTIAGDHFTFLHNFVQVATPRFFSHPGNIPESNLKKTIAQQIINNPTE